MRYPKEISMNKYLIGIIALTLFQSCIDAPSNGRKRAGNTPDRTPQKDECTNCVVGSIEVYKSQMYRSRGTEQFTLETLQKAVATGKLPDTYHIITKPEINNDTQIIRHNQSFKICGQSGDHTTIKKRLAHCTKMNPSNYLWSGRVNGISGEGDWQLLAKLDETSESILWMDKTTNLIWSSLLKPQTWNRASGMELEENDQSYCSSLNELSKDQINWRLPNRNEFLQADLNGARFVLTDTDNTFWTASSDSSDYKNYAWTIRQNTGELVSVDKNMPHEVRCVGVIIK
jgi:hypothetical protein